MNAEVNLNNKKPKADLVVVGGGGAGLAAAVAAAEKGASVIVLEKRGLGGNSALAWGIFAAESPTQRREMIDCRKDDCFKLAMDFAHWNVNPRLVRAFIDKSGNTIQWLEEKGLEFTCIPFYPNQAAAGIAEAALNRMNTNRLALKNGMRLNICNKFRQCLVVSINDRRNGYGSKC
ncbi:MAG: FAD-dependent oxidoreductase [Promethearchaeota archaeon]